MGSQGVAMDVIYDNASDWLTIEGSACDTCEGNTFDISGSTSATQVQQDFSQR